MPRRVTSLSLAVALSLSLGAIAPVAHAAPATLTTATTVPAAPAPAVKRTIENLNLRQSQGTSGKVLLVIPKGATVSVGKTSKGWVQVTYSRRTGWVNAKFLTLAAPAKSTAKPAAKSYRYLSSYQVLRASASAGSRSLGGVERRTQVERLGSSGSWTKVRVSGKTGYLPSTQLATARPAVAYRWTGAAQPLYKSASTRAAKVSTLAAGTKMEWRRASGSWSYVTAAGKSGWVPSSALRTSAPAPKSIGSRWALDRLTLRATASNSAKSAGTVNAGQKLSLYQTSGSWSRVGAGKSIGWVSSASLVSQSYAASSKSVWTRSTTKVYSAAATNSRSLGSVASGSKLTALGTSGKFTRAKTSRGTGWVLSSSLSTTAPAPKSIGSRWALDRLTLRATASNSAKSAGTVNAGQKLSLYQTSGSWSRVGAGNAIGWVPSASLLSQSYAPSSAKSMWLTAATTARSGAASSSAAAGSLARGTKVTVIGSSNGFSRLSAPRAGWVPIASLSSKAPVVDKVIGTRWALAQTTIRSAGSSSASSVGTLAAGQKVNLLAASGSWSKIQAGSRTGWVPSIWLLNSAYTSLAAKPYWATTGVNFRSEPNTVTRPVGVIAKDEQVTVVGSSGSWMRVTTRLGAGWMSGTYLTATKPAPEIKPAAPTAPTPIVAYRWTTATVNVRTGPGTNNPALGAIVNGSKVTYLKSSGGWANVTTSLGTGWISETYLANSAIAEVQPDLEKVIAAVRGRFGDTISATYTLRSGSKGHSSGKAVDLMIRNYKLPSRVAEGDRIAQFLLDNRIQLGIDYLIWQDEIWLTTTGWTAYSTSGRYGNQFIGNWNDTTRHMDHIHVEVKGNAATGGPLDLSALR